MMNLLKQSMNTAKQATLTLALVLVFAWSMADTSLAQSTHREYPTPLTANMIKGEFHQSDPEYFYAFSVDTPTSITLTLELQAKNYGGALYVTLFDRNGRELAAFDKLVMKGQTAKVVKEVQFMRAQEVILRIYSGNGEGYYRLTLDQDALSSSIGSAPIVNQEPSTDRDHPSPLPASEIADEFHQDDPEYFYTFVAEPGTLTFTLNLKAKNYGGALYVTLYDSQGRKLAAFDQVVLKGQSEKVVKEVFFAKRQRVVMRIFSGNGEGYYTLRLSGLDER